MGAHHLQGTRLSLNGICDNLYKPSTSIDMFFYFLYHIKSIAGITFCLFGNSVIVDNIVYSIYSKHSIYINQVNTTT
jgi:hypothetical protein